MRRAPARLRVLLLVIVIAIVGAGCGVEATVSVSMRENGSGIVRLDAVLDAEAVMATEAGGGKLETRVRLEDLADAGWTVSPWVRRPDGSARVELSKRFELPAQVEGILGELSGPDGPLRDVRFTRERHAFSTGYAARAVVDLEAIGTGIQGDQELAAALAAQRVDVAALDQSLLDQLRKALTVRMTVDLPGEHAHTVVAEPGKRVELALAGNIADTRRIVLSAAAVVLLLAAIFVALIGRRARR